MVPSAYSSSSLSWSCSSSDTDLTTNGLVIEIEAFGIHSVSSSGTPMFKLAVLDRDLGKGVVPLNYTAAFPSCVASFLIARKVQKLEKRWQVRNVCKYKCIALCVDFSRRCDGKIYFDSNKSVAHLYNDLIIKDTSKYSSTIGAQILVDRIEKIFLVLGNKVLMFPLAHYTQSQLTSVFIKAWSTPVHNTSHRDALGEKEKKTKQTEVLSVDGRLDEAELEEEADAEQCPDRADCDEIITFKRDTHISSAKVLHHPSSVAGEIDRVVGTKSLDSPDDILFSVKGEMAGQKTVDVGKAQTESLKSSFGFKINEQNNCRREGEDEVHASILVTEQEGFDERNKSVTKVCLSRLSLVITEREKKQERDKRPKKYSGGYGEKGPDLPTVDIINSHAKPEMRQPADIWSTTGKRFQEFEAKQVFHECNFACAGSYIAVYSPFVADGILVSEVCYGLQQVLQGTSFNENNWMIPFNIVHGSPSSKVQPGELTCKHLFQFYAKVAVRRWDILQTASSSQITATDQKSNFVKEINHLVPDQNAELLSASSDHAYGLQNTLSPVVRHQKEEVPLYLSNQYPFTKGSLTPLKRKACFGWLSDDEEDGSADRPATSGPGYQLAKGFCKEDTAIGSFFLMERKVAYLSERYKLDRNIEHDTNVMLSKEKVFPDVRSTEHDCRVESNEKDGRKLANDIIEQHGRLSKDTEYKCTGDQHDQEKTGKSPQIPHRKPPFGDNIYHEASKMFHNVQKDDNIVGSRSINASNRSHFSYHTVYQDERYISDQRKIRMDRKQSLRPFKRQSSYQEKDESYESQQRKYRIKRMQSFGRQHLEGSIGGNPRENFSEGCNRQKDERKSEENVDWSFLQRATISHDKRYLCDQSHGSEKEWKSVQAKDKAPLQCAVGGIGSHSQPARNLRFVVVRCPHKI
eukprot:Gb_09453 [translate_table: standard]